MRRVLALAIFVFLALNSAAAYGQGNGIGGVLIRDVPIPNDEEEWPKILPAGGLVAFGSGNDWSASQRKQGKVLIHFVIREEDGGRDRAFVKIPEDAVHVFNWACGEPMENIFSKRDPIICSPFVGRYAPEEWQLRFVAEARKVAQSLGLKLIEEFSPAYQGGASAGAGAISPPTSSSPPKCTVDQILKMKEAGLSDAQIKAACGG